MAHSFTELLDQAANQAPIGGIVFSKVNLEKQFPGRFLRLDGRVMRRSQLPKEISDALPASAYTLTTRTMAASPTSTYCCVATPTYFVAAGASGTAAIQYSTDGITWSTTSVVTPASTAVQALVWTGVRLIAAVTGSAQPLVTTGDNPNSTWTATTGGINSVANCGLAYSPSLGRAVLVPSGASSSCYTLNDGATAWTTRTRPASYTAGSVIWTGDRFINLTNTGSMLESSDGITWVEYHRLPLWAGNGSTYQWQANRMGADGTGQVLIVPSSSQNYIVYYSKDYGTTWRFLMAAPLGPVPPFFYNGVAYFAGGTHETVIGADFSYSTPGYGRGLMVQKGSTLFCMGTTATAVIDDSLVYLPLVFTASNESAARAGLLGDDTYMRIA